MIPVHEAKLLKIKVVGVMNSDTDPEAVNLPIPANDRSKVSVDYILARLEKAITEGRSMSAEVAKVVKA
jgi:small subunit ribosomal protein S2